MLLRNGADVNIGEGAATPLHIAAIHGKSQMKLFEWSEYHFELFKMFENRNFTAWKIYLH